MKCNKCGSNKMYNSSFVKGGQRYKCKDCGRQFVPTLHRGKSETEKLTAVLLHINGLSLRTIHRTAPTRKTSFGYGKLIVALPVSLSAGNVDGVVASLAGDCLTD